MRGVDVYGFFRLLARSWSHLMTAFSMSTVGFVALSCVLPIAVYLALTLVPAYSEGLILRASAISASAFVGPASLLSSINVRESRNRPSRPSGSNP